jgi:hypothetical protein
MNIKPDTKYFKGKKYFLGDVSKSLETSINYKKYLKNKGYHVRVIKVKRIPDFYYDDGMFDYKLYWR